jgi:hypothetical protein
MYELIGLTRNIAIRRELSFEALTEEPMTPCALPFFPCGLSPAHLNSCAPKFYQGHPPLFQGSEFHRGLLILHLPAFRKGGYTPGLNTYKQHIEKLLTSCTSKGLDVQTNEQIFPPSVRVLDA